MILYTQRAGVMSILLILLLVSVCFAAELKVETSTLSENSDIENSSSEPEKSSGSSWFFPIDDIHEVIRKERIAALLEIDEQRKTTLVYLTQERIAVVEELKAELKRITDLLVLERRAMIIEMEATGNLIAENALLKSERLIDHFFIRTLQFVAVMAMAAILLGFIIFRVMAKGKNAQKSEKGMI